MKQLALILVFALLICTCGCQPASLSGGPSTEPSNGDPGETVTEPSQDTQATEHFEYITIVEDDGSYGDPEPEKPVVAVLRSPEDCPDSILELLENTVASYDEGYFEDHSIIVFCGTTGSSGDRYRVADVSETDEGGYLLSVEYCTPEGGDDMMWHGRVVVAVNRAIPQDADIQAEISTNFMSNDEFEDYFGDTGGCC